MAPYVNAIFSAVCPYPAQAFEVSLPMDAPEILPNMEISNIASRLGNATGVRPFSRNIFAAFIIGFIGLSLPMAVSHAQPANNDESGAEVVTRGPVHEAFAGVVSYNPEPGI